MKKSILGLAVAAVALAGCSKNQTDSITPEAYDSKYINFMSSTLSKTVNNADIADLKAAAGFEVYAFGKDAGADKLYFTKPDGTTFSSAYTWTEATSVWGWKVVSDDKKWPAEADAAKYPMTFIAAHPSATFKATLDANYDITDIVATPYDWAHDIAVEDVTANQVDYMAAKYEAAKNLGTAVPFNFKHIMSNVKFAVKTPKDFTAYVVGVKIHNLHNADKYNFFTEKWAKLATTTAASVGTNHYVHCIGNMQTLVSDGTSQAIGANDPTTSLKLMPQNYATAWNLGATDADAGSFKAAAKAWLAEAAPRPEWNTYPAAVAAFNSGVYVELIYALVDNNDVCLVGKIDGKKVNNGGNLETYTGDNRFLRVGYVVDLAKVGGLSGWAPGKRYTYTIALGTLDASNGTVLDPTYTKQDGTETSPKEDSGKDPATPVNPVPSEYIGFDVTVSDWSEGVASFE